MVGIEGTMAYPTRVAGHTALNTVAEQLAIAYGLDDTADILRRLEEQQSLGWVQYPSSY